MKRSYHKLVRDKIPEIIEASGKSCEVTVLNDQDYLKEIDRKLKEELIEYLVDGSIEELADLVEVVRAATVARGSSWDELEQIRLRKLNENGGFREKLFLISTDD